MSDITTLMMAAAGGGVEETDPNFNQTVLLLHGDGTNGAQNNTFVDSSTNNFTVTRNGNTTQGTFSPFSAPDGRWSNYFAPADHISTPNNAAVLLGNSDFTIEAWIYVTEHGTTLTGISSVWKSSGDERSWLFSVTASSIEFRFSTNGTAGAATALSHSTTINLNTWYWVAVTRSGNTFSFYVNGTRVGTSTNSSTFFAGTEPHRIADGNVSTTDGRFGGYVSNYRLVKGTALYTAATVTVPTSPLTTTSQGASSSEVEVLSCQSNRFVDNSSNAFAITRNGDVKVTPFSPFAPTAAYDASVNGGSGYFDGSGDYLTLTDTNNDLDLGGIQASLDFWAYVPSSSTSYQAIIKGNANSYSVTDGIHWGLAQVSSNWNFSYNNSGSGASITGTAPAPNQWTHVCVATDTSNNIALFINGSRVATASNAITKPTTRTGIKIGESLAGSADWSGYMSGLRFLTGANAYDPTDTTITIPTAPPTNVTGTELLCNFTNAGIFDNTGKNNLETVGNAQIDTTTKKYGTGSMEFDGTGDYLFMGSSAQTQNFVFGTGDFTIEMWVYFNSVASGSLFEFRPAATNGAYPLVYFSSSGVLTYYANSGARINSSSVSTGQWYHFALTRSGTDTKMFLNGTQTGSTYTDSSNYLCRTGGPIIGVTSDLSSDALNGYIDDLRITKGVARTITVPTKAYPDL